MRVPHVAYLTAVQICIQPTTGRPSLAVERLALAERRRMLLADVESQVRADERPLRGEPLTPTVVLRDVNLTPTPRDVFIHLQNHTTSTIGSHAFPRADGPTCMGVLIRTNKRAGRRTYGGTYIQTDRQTYMQPCMQTYTHTGTRECGHTDIQADIRTYV